MSTATAFPLDAGPQRRRDIATISTIGVAHGSSHFFHMLLPPLFPAFIQAFGLIRWRAITQIDLVEIAERAMTVHELQIALNGPLGSALVADWRKRPAYRLLMRLPWRMDHRGVVRVNLEPFDRTPDEIHRTFLRMWRYYRS